MFRLTKSSGTEDDLHAAVAHALDILLLPPTVWTTFPAAHVKLPHAAAAKLSRVGLKSGWPDVLVLYGGTLVGIERKRPGAALSRTRTGRTRRGGLRIVEGQRDTFPRPEAAGMRLAVCSSVDEVLNALDGWGFPLRRSAKEAGRASD